MERVRAGLRNAVAKGKRLGGPRRILDAAKIAARRAEGCGWKRLARELACGVSTVRRVGLAAPQGQVRGYGKAAQGRGAEESTGTQNKCLPNQAEVRELRTLIAKANWKPASSPEYKSAPHSYIVKMKRHGLTAAQWQRLADIIARSGTWRTWRGKRYRYLAIDRKVYWVMWPVLNRADAATLDG